MKKVITLLAVGSMIFAGAVSASAQEQANTGSYNQKATDLFVSRAKAGQITPETLQKFKDKKADINAMYENSKGVRTNLLLESCCFPNIMDIQECNDGSFNFTPEYLNRMNVLIKMVELGADTNVKNGSGKNAVSVAIISIANEKFREGIVKYLHKTAHVDITSADNKGITPLMYALVVTKDLYLREDGGVPPLVSYLVNEKADVNAADNDGLTPLMGAAQYNTLETVKYLIEHGANISATTKKGKTAMDFAKRRQSQKIANYLEEKMMDEL